jgi:hypothetical protein
MKDAIDIDFIRLKAKALDTGHLKLATWGTKEELANILIGNCADHYQNDKINR